MGVNRRSPSPPARAVATRPFLAAIYWLTPALLTGIQAWVSVIGMHQIRYEELAESVRNVFWLDHRLIYDGISSNVGWYGTLLLAYKLFGFSLSSAKYVRLGLHLVSLYCAASLLRRVMDTRMALLPLLFVGLSPTRLYFDSLQTSYGLDLSYAAICLWLIMAVRPASQSMTEYGKTFLCGIVAMVAAMSYPSFLCYLPSLVIVAAWWIRKGGETGMAGSNRVRLWHALSAGAGFLLPLVAALVFLRTRQLLIYDPETQAGLFRGGGAAGFNVSLVAQAMTAVFKDLFVHGQSYYFELTQPEFSGWLGIVSVCGVGVTAVYFALTRQPNRTLVSATLLLLAASVLLPCLSTDSSPGLRRCTGVLAAYAVVFTWAWSSCAGSTAGSLLARRSGMALCLLALLATTLKLPSLLADAGADSSYRNVDWFAVEATPTESVEFFASQLQSGQRLSCPSDAAGKPIPCRYQEIYPAIAGYRQWNGLAPIEMRAVDWRTGGDITLTPSLWSDHYYPTCARLETCR